MKLLKLFSTILCCLLLTSCGRRISITNNTFADRQAIPSGFKYGSAFYIEPLEHKNRLFAKEMQHKIATLLNEQGFVVTSSDRADYQLSCTMDMVTSTITVQVPHYIPGEKIIIQGCKHKGEDDQTYTETKETVGTMVYTPEERIIFKHKLQMDVYQIAHNSDQNKKELVWQASANTTGDDNDQRDVIDYLLVSVFKYFGKNTKKSVRTDVSERSKEMKRLRK